MFLCLSLLSGGGPPTWVAEASSRGQKEFVLQYLVSVIFHSLLMDLCVGKIHAILNILWLWLCFSCEQARHWGWLVVCGYLGSSSGFNGYMHGLSQPGICLSQPWPQPCLLRSSLLLKVPLDVGIISHSKPSESSLTPHLRYSPVISFPGRISMSAELGDGWGGGSSPTQEWHRFPLFFIQRSASET